MELCNTARKANYFLKSRRLGFRRWTEEDFELALDLWGDYEVTRYIDARGRLTKGQVQDRLNKEIELDREFGVQYWPVFLLETDEHVGSCGLRPYDLKRGVYEIGFHIRSDLWGRGFAKEAAQAVIAYAFESLEASALFAGHNPKNEISRHLLENLGFQYTHDEFFPPTGLMHPSYVLDRL